jgi:hypothetical protein
MIQETQSRSISYENDLKSTSANLLYNKICPYYFFLEKLVNNKPEIIICTYKDYFDMKTRLQISKLIDDDKNYNLIFDESSDIENILTNYYTLCINDTLLFNASNQLFILKEKYESINHTESFKLLDKETKDISRPENESIIFNSFPDYSKSNLPGNINKTSHVLNLLTRLIFYFRKIFTSKTESVWHINKLQFNIWTELWINAKTLSYIFKRFMVFLNEIKFTDYNR